MNRDEMRFELAKAAMQGMFAAGTRQSDEMIAKESLAMADCMLAALQITPEAVAESQQVSAGIGQLRYIVQLRYIGPSGMGITNGNVYSGVRSSDNFNFRDNHNNHRRMLLNNFEVIDNA